MAISYENVSNTLNHNVIDIKSEFIIDALHIFVLFSFAFAQPLFDVMSKYAEFFVARKSEPIDVILLILILCLVFPAIPVLIEGAVALFGRRFRKAAHWFMVAILSAVIALQVLSKILEIPGLLLIMMASALGVAATIAYVRLRPARVFLTVLSPAILIFPGLFLFNSPVHKVVFPEKDPSAIDIKIDDPPPIIMVVFDEFPVISLMDEQGQIDAIRYPNFAKFARDSYWFRNAMTVAAQTTLAVPAIVTGNYPDPLLQATATDYPENLFTLLGGTYDLRIYEIVTQLCPSRLSERGGDSDSSLVQRMHFLLSDLSIVYLYIVLPSDLTTGLPSIMHDWKDFVKTTAQPPGAVKSKIKRRKDQQERTRKVQRADRSWQFSKFIDSIDFAGRPRLYFLHIKIPHRPWEHFPSGKIYRTFCRNRIWDFLPHGKKRHAKRIRGTGVGKKCEIWCEDEWIVCQGHQLHLLEVGFADKLVGELINKLVEIDHYDKSLIVMTADHGISFRPNDYLRIARKTNSADILNVPLFIKAPNQQKGAIRDRKVLTIDILPTIAEILGIQLPYIVEGQSALSNSHPQRSEVVFFNPKGRA